MPEKQVELDYLDVFIKVIHGSRIHDFSSVSDIRYCEYLISALEQLLHEITVFCLECRPTTSLLRW